jgi:hypothetical protein
MKIIQQFFTIIFLLFLILIGCKSQCDCYQQKVSASFENRNREPWIIKLFQVDSLRTIIKENGMNAMFGWHIYISNDDTLLTFLTDDRNLIKFDIQRNTIRSKLSLSSLTQLNGTYVSYLRGDTLLQIKQKGNIYYKYVLNSQSNPKLIESFNIGDSPLFKNCDLSFIVGRQGVVYNPPFLYFKYGIQSEKDNFISNTAYVEFNTVDKTMRKMVSYPACYHCCRVYLPTSSMAILSNGQPVVMFDSFDALFFIDKNGLLKDNSPVVHRVGDSCKMQAFDESQHENLSYVRKYLAKNEVNTALLKTPANQLLVVQRQGKRTLYDESVFRIYLFDTSHNQIYSSEIPYKLSNVLEYKNGIIALNDSLNKVYYYDFKN